MLARIAYALDGLDGLSAEEHLKAPVLVMLSVRSATRPHIGRSREGRAAFDFLWNAGEADLVGRSPH